MIPATQTNTTPALDLQAAAETAALLARIFPRWKGDTSEGAVAAPRPPRSPAPATSATRVLEVA